LQTNVPQQITTIKKKRKSDYKCCGVMCLEMLLRLLRDEEFNFTVEDIPFIRRRISMEVAQGKIFSPDVLESMDI
jgi:hypothetical protein